MTVRRWVDEVWRNPIGRLLSLLFGAGLVAGALTLYPRLLPLVRWAGPVCLVLWGASRFYLHGAGKPPTAAAGCLLILGGFTYALYLLVPMGELTGTVARLVPVIGIFGELFAAYHRERDRSP